MQDSEQTRKAAQATVLLVLSCLRSLVPTSHQPHTHNQQAAGAATTAAVRLPAALLVACTGNFYIAVQESSSCCYKLAS
jgi:hypothetical protein